MEVILLERVEKLGQMGDVVRVKPGFARNYLLPKNKALRSTADNRKLFEAQKAQLETNNLNRKRKPKRLPQRSTACRSSFFAKRAKAASFTDRSTAVTLRRR